MDGTRRTFLSLAGLGVLGVAGAGAVKAVAQDGDPAGIPSTSPDAASPQPLTAVRYAMVVNLKAIDEHHSWDAIVEACNRAHNVPHFDSPKDEVKWIWTEEFESAFPSQEQPYVSLQHHDKKVPVLCNHCDNPPCTRVCPTQATWRRESDGIVMMDWHRCIGCRYCVVACPYGSRSFNWRDPRGGLEHMTADYPTRQRGVVEKCTFCEERLAKGQLPACVEACENNEIVFGDLEDPNSKVRALLRENFTIRRKATLGTHPQIYYIV
jgi:molybdopterin-containing oxidoreductase family iron-sulfur binding subunit